MNENHKIESTTNIKTKIDYQLHNIMNEQQPKELLWPPNGYVFEEESILPAYCKPKICPLKSLTLEKLEKMQEDANRRLKELEEKEREEKQNIGMSEEVSSDNKKADIWKAEEEE
ncbi:hypothetical protein Mgra_00010129 [Meloidogyne graminicola]|uniref:Uncharacterized protein n=1 Tax=Meloidogyne graminicola TaxID=189291 RepID=A0A8S9Z7M4_9BILA|nr:hypothetical protein Mgra_00010129 [Meloidogyne graminicola]